MKITFSRTGGIIGAHDSVVIDTDTDPISQKEKDELYSAFEKTRFITRSSESGMGPDLFHYKISIEKTVEVDEGTTTANELKPLIDLLMSKVKPSK